MDRCSCDRPSLGGDLYEHRATCPKAPQKVPASQEDARLSWPIEWPDLCGKTLACGGACVLPAIHQVPCECCGDDPGEPGTCPA